MFKKTIIIGLAFLLGAISYRYASAYHKSVADQNKNKPNYSGIKDFTDESNANRVALKPLNSRGGVFLVFGQSNTTNSFSDLYESKNNVYYVYKNKTYQYKDPVLGMDGEGGSMWGLVGDKLIDKGIYDWVVFKCVGRGATSILDWQPNKGLYKRIVDGNTELKKLNLQLSGILFHQGEGDNQYRNYKLRSNDYYHDFLKIKTALNKEGITAPIYMSIASLGDSPVDTVITNAQEKLCKVKGIRRGVNTDTLVGRKYRYDNTHFNYYGAHVVSDLWVRCLAK